MRKGLNRQIGVTVLGLMLFAAAVQADTTETRYFAATLSPANEVPAVTTESGSAEVLVTVFARRNDAGATISGIVYYDINYNLAQQVTFNNMHIHVGAAGENGPTRFNAALNTSNITAS